MPVVLLTWRHPAGSSPRKQLWKSTTTGPGALFDFYSYGWCLLRSRALSETTFKITHIHTRRLPNTTTAFYCWRPRSFRGAAPVRKPWPSRRVYSSCWRREEHHTFISFTTTFFKNLVVNHHERHLLLRAGVSTHRESVVHDIPSGIPFDISKASP